MTSMADGTELQPTKAGDADGVTRTNQSRGMGVGGSENGSHTRQPPSQQPGATQAQRVSESDQAQRGQAKAGCCKRTVHSFTQQKLKAWQPVLTPRWVISVFLVIGIVFVGFGIALIVTTNLVKECKVRYSDPCSDMDNPPIQCVSNETVTFDSTDCLAVGSSDEVLQPPVFLYYELNNFYQNHRGYVLSRSDAQLKGEVITNASKVSSCSPIITRPDNAAKILHPCGLIAWTVFNDSYNVTDGNGDPVVLDESANAIAWESDVESKFKNPDPNDPGIAEIDQWLPEEIFPGKIESGHFIVWMRNAALPNFRKLYARIDQPIQLPATVTIRNRYFVETANARKYVVLTTSSWVGGRNPFLGIAYTVVGVICLILAIAFFVRHWRKPRILGDVRYLNWVGAPRRNA